MQKRVAAVRKNRCDDAGAGVGEPHGDVADGHATSIRDGIVRARRKDTGCDAELPRSRTWGLSTSGCCDEESDQCDPCSESHGPNMWRASHRRQNNLAGGISLAYCACMSPRPAFFTYFFSYGYRTPGRGWRRARD